MEASPNAGVNTSSPPSPASSTSSTSIFSQSRSNTSRQNVPPVLEFWKAFDLDTKRTALGEQGSKMKMEKDNSMKARKQLAEATKDFRKLPDDQKLTDVNNLLRSYQQEIDNLTRRAKYAEGAFFHMYKGLYRAPDPVPALESANDSRITELEDENKRLQKELQEYDEEFSSLKNQDITIRKLEDTIASYESSMEETISEQVDEKCRELEQEMDAKSAEFQEQKLDYERQLETSRSELRDAFARLDAMQSELFTRKQREKLRDDSLETEMESVAQETMLTQTLQLENAQLKKQVEQLQSRHETNESDSTVSSTENTTSQLEERDSIIADLRTKLTQAQDDAMKYQKDAEEGQERWRDRLQEKEKEIERLQAEVSLRPTSEAHNDVIHELKVLRQLEYNIVDDDESAMSNEAGVAPASELERVLVSRVRRAESTLKQNQLSVQEKEQELAQAQEKLSQRDATIEELQMVLRNLEENVAALEQNQSNQSRDSLAPGTGADILRDALNEESETNKSDGKMLEIVRGQRDRFRERSKELQDEKTRLEEQVKGLQLSVSRLEQDNMQLYHKIRYLQNYQSGGKGNRNVQPKTGEYAVDMDQVDETEGRYQSKYEQRMNPFAQFNKMESKERYSNLNAVDKILLPSAKLVLGHRITRAFAFGYILLLHLLVIATLYTFTHSCNLSNDLARTP